MSINRIDGILLAKMFKRGTLNLNKNKQLVDALNVYPVPDGDTGTNMSLTMNATMAEMSKVEPASVEVIAKTVSKGSLMGARGNSGVILSQIFRGFAKGCAGQEELDVKGLALAFEKAAESAYSAVLKPVEGTILTVIRQVSEKAEAHEDDDMLLHHFMKMLVEQAEVSLASTPDYLEVLRQAGVVDAGGKGLLCILEGFYEAIMGIEDEIEEVPVVTPLVAETTMHQPVDVDIKFQYCTEFLVKGDNLTETSLKNDIVEMGDSMVYVADDEIIKVHIHTNDPGTVLQSALVYGQLSNIKIENMKEQHSEIIGQEGYTQQPVIPKEKKKYGFVAVTMGDGLRDIFKDMGVDYVISGGQTMNPSTEDILKAVDEVHAEHVFVLPNNSNIILAANQAKKISEKDIHVIPSKSCPQGFAAMIGFNPSSEPAENFDRMVENLKEVKTIQMTYAVRDTLFNDMTIQAGNILGVAEGEIKHVGEGVEDVTLETFKKVIDEDSEIVTIYYGEEVTESDAKALAERIEETFEDVEVEVYAGKQPLYYYVCSVE